MTDQQKRRVTIWRREYQGSYDACCMTDFMVALRAVASDVADDDLHNVAIRFVAGESDDGNYYQHGIEFEYGREETDKEMAYRVQTTAEQLSGARHAYEANERASAAYMQAKYGSNKP